MTIGPPEAVAVVVLAGHSPFTWSYILGTVAGTPFCIMVWWQLCHPGR